MTQRQPLPTAVAQFRRRLLCGLIPLCLFVAGYCVTAGLASGGWRTNRDGEPSYSAPVHRSREFYTGLRWSVTVVGGIMAVTSYCWGHPRVCAVFGAVAALFNPILTIHLPKGTWEVIDLLAFWVFLVGPGYLWPSDADGFRPLASTEAPKAEPGAAPDRGGAGA
jgi:hypothetical protein